MQMPDDARMNCWVWMCHDRVIPIGERLALLRDARTLIEIIRQADQLMQSRTARVTSSTHHKRKPAQNDVADCYQGNCDSWRSTAISAMILGSALA